tara:strand:+ start:356 stop:793 length:438 start_codon:yes stop_codon:yes gene_type:complete
MAKKRQTKYSKALAEAKRNLSHEYLEKVRERSTQKMRARHEIKERGTGVYHPKSMAPTFVRTEEAKELRRKMGKNKNRMEWNLTVGGIATVSRDTTCGDAAGMSTVIKKGTIVMILSEARESDNYLQVMVNGVPTWIAAGRLRTL